jgi:hypothetical protein
MLFSIMNLCKCEANFEDEILFKEGVVVTTRNFDLKKKKKKKKKFRDQIVINESQG